MPFGSGISALTAILLGIALGFILQRGRFCLNSAFRDIIFIQDLTFFRAYLLCLVVAILGTNILESAGLIMTYDQDAGRFVSTELMRQSFVAIANILGGFLFGLGIVLAADVQAVLCTGSERARSVLYCYRRILLRCWHDHRRMLSLSVISEKLQG